MIFNKKMKKATKKYIVTSYIIRYFLEPKKIGNTSLKRINREDGLFKRKGVPKEHK